MRAALIFLAFCGLFLVSCEQRSDVEIANEQGILIVGNSNEPKGLDPHLVSGVLESNIIRALFEGLCTEDPKRDGQSLPGVAERWESNADSTEWTFYLNPEAKWSDGVPVTAHDFVFSYQRLLSPDPNWPAKYGEMLYFLKNGKEYNKGEISDFAKVGVKAIDDFTLRCTLRGPVPFLPEITKHYTWYPVPKHCILEHGEMNTAFSSPWTRPGNLISNGPFQLKSWTTNHKLEVEKNPHYWDRENVSLNGIRYLPVSNSYTEARMFGDGQVHVTYTVPADLLPFARREYPDQLREEPYVGCYFIRTNTKKPLLSDPRVRRAFALAIDRKAITDKILYGGPKPATGITPPFGDYKPPAVFKFDPEKGRALLQEAGFDTTTKSAKISLLTTDRDSSRRLAEALQAMWSEHLGVNVDIIQREWTTYLQLQYDGNFDLATGGWIGDYLDPTTFLEMWITDGGNNNTGWGSTEYEELLNQAEDTADPTARYQTLAKAEELMLRDAPIIPMYWATTNYLIRPEVKGWHPLLLNNHPFKHVSLATDSE